MKRGTLVLNRLKEEYLQPALLESIQQFTDCYPIPENLKDRLPVPSQFYYGKEIWEAAVCAILSGKNLLLAGHKATGKNIFAENLAAIFGRPRWDISFHVNMDASTLIGCDTFENGKVVFRPGPVFQCAKYGGFGILDEINMAKNEALAVLHAALDFRRVIDVPGYERIPLHPAARFIATMNYGYAGTKELNEALTSRFVVIQMPMITHEQLKRLLQCEFPAIKTKYAEQFAALFLELQKKCENSEISSKPLDLRGLLDAVALMERGLEAHTALDMGITNKSFDIYEQTFIRDIIHTRIPRHLEHNQLFEV
ncbi:MAG: MoxR family ATPase [Clostridiales bacterium]|nr:MoxR family ATPase [Clostridiales bacterium]